MIVLTLAIRWAQTFLDFGLICDRGIIVLTQTFPVPNVEAKILLQLGHWIILIH